MRRFALFLSVLLTAICIAAPPPLKEVNAPGSVTSGQDFSATVTLSAPCPSLFPVALKVDLPYIKFKGAATVLFFHGSSSASVNLVAAVVAVPTVVVLTAVGPSNSVKTSITVNPVHLADVEIFGPTKFQSTGDILGVVRISSITTTDLTVLLHSDSAWAIVSGSTIIPAGSDHVFFTVVAARPVLDSQAKITATMGGQSISAFVSAEGPHIESVTFGEPELSPGKETLGEVTMEEPAPGDLTVSLDHTGANCVIPDSVTVPKGKTMASFPLFLPKDAGPGLQATVTASYDTYTVQGDILVTDIYTQNVAMAPPVVGPGTFKVPVLLSGHVGSGYSLIVTADAPLTVIGGVSNGIQTTLPVPVGVSTAYLEFSVPAVGSAAIAHYTVRHTGGDQIKNRVAILPAPNPSISISPATPNARQNTTCTIILDFAATKDLVLALSGAVWLRLPASVTIPKGEKTATFTFQPLDPPGPFQSQDSSATIQAQSNDPSQPFNKQLSFCVLGANIKSVIFTSNITEGPSQRVVSYYSTLDAPLATGSHSGGLTIEKNEAGDADSVVLNPAQVEIPPASSYVTQTVTSGSASDKFLWLAGFTADAEEAEVLSILFRTLFLSVPLKAQSGDNVVATVTLNAKAPPQGAQVTVQLDPRRFGGWTSTAMVPAGQSQISFPFFPNQVFGKLTQECSVWVSGSPVPQSISLTINPIDPPHRLAVQYPLGGKSVKLSWQPSASQGIKYDIYRSPIPGQLESTPYATVDGGTTEFVDSGVFGDSAYYYYVATEVNPASGRLFSEPSNEVSASVAKPLPPTHLMARKPSSTLLELTWLQSPSPNINYYNLYRNMGHGWLLYQKISRGAVRFENGMGSGNYSFYMTAVGLNGLESDHSNTANLLVDSIPEAPTDVTATGKLHGIMVKWTASASSHVSGYVIYRSVIYAAQPAMIPIGATSSPTLQFFDASVNVGTTYGYSVSAISSEGIESGLSSGTSETMPAYLTSVSAASHVVRGDSVGITINLAGTTALTQYITMTSSDASVLSGQAFAIPGGDHSLFVLTNPTSNFIGAGKTITLTFTDLEGNVVTAQLVVE